MRLGRFDRAQHSGRVLSAKRRSAGWAVVALGLSGAAAVLGVSLAAQTSMTPSSMARIATVDERYQSYNVEMAEVSGGNFWKPYDRDSLSKLKSPPPPDP